MKTREQIISDMCYTWRHDYGLTKHEEDILSSGMTEIERKALWSQMEQLYEHVISPLLQHQVYR